jgi:DNA uptake protein ComE-like DNA-binding protein
MWMALLAVSLVAATGWRKIEEHMWWERFEGITLEVPGAMDLLCALEEVELRVWQASKSQNPPKPQHRKVESPGRKQQEPFQMNALDSAAWEALPWIGAKTASRIVRYREALGGFHSPHQIRDIYYIHDSAVTFVERWGRADATEILQLCADTASWADMRAHPAIGLELARYIERYRAHHPLHALDDLLNSQAIDSAQFAPARPYLKVCLEPGG